MSRARSSHTFDRALVWFRRDLRTYDHAALSLALERSQAVFCAFVFDTEILDALTERRDRRVEFIRESVLELDHSLRKLGGALWSLHGRARDVIPGLAVRLKVQAVYANRDYEPAAMERDHDVQRRLLKHAIDFHTCKDQVIFECDEVLTQSQRPFSVFTPYKRAWLSRLRPADVRPHAVAPLARALASCSPPAVPSLTKLGFQRSNLRALELPTGTSGGKRWLEEFVARIDAYHHRRDYPALRGPSYLSVHLRFGTLSIRDLVRAAQRRRSAGARTWLSELIWREFYCMILYHHPRVVHHAFRPELEQVRFSNRQDHFRAWCEARTGYPLVDAAMRQINQTGYMHNRLRMVSASFLVKDLHVDWRWGERYFAQHLNDYDLANNNGGWQWAASTGCDAQPYFRIFNPVTQSQRFDRAGRFIRQYIPELANVADRFIHAPWTMTRGQQEQAGVIIGKDYPAPIVDHAQARALALRLYREASAERTL
jgi:deoxyribodipyrimidine photo-lyase